MLLPPLPTFAQSSVVIGEVQWAGSEASSADEWIELWNLGNTPFSLNGYHLRGVGSGRDLIFTSQDTIPANSTYLIANYASTDPKTTLAINAPVVTTTLSITNEQTHIELVDANNSTIDRVEWDKAAPAGSSATPRSSMVRTSTAQDTTTPWTTPTARQNLKTTFVQYGTPGFCDGCTTRAAQPTDQIELQAPDPPPIDPIIIDSPIEPENPIMTDDARESLEDFLTSSTAAELIDTPPSSNELAPTDPDPTLFENISTEIEMTTTTAPSTETLPVTQAITPEESIEPITTIIVTSTTSTAPVVTGVATTTDIALDVASTDTPSSTSQSLSVQPPVIASSTPLFAAPVPPPAPILHFHEVLANPNDGNEWIEFSVQSLTNLDQLTNWVIRDTTRTLITFTPTSQLTYDPLSHFLVFSFPKGKLADKGTHLFLRNASGIVVDELTIPATGKNQSWARATPAGAEWKKTLEPTPLKENVIREKTSLLKTVATKKETGTKPPGVPSKKPATTKTKIVPSSKNPVAPKEIVTTVVTNMAAKAVKQPKITKRNTAGTKVKTPLKTVVRKTTPKKKKTTSKEKPIQDVALADLSSMTASTRVRVTGTVATLPRLLNSQTFVIQTDDGRGLYVYANTKQTSPPFRAQVEITGTLVLNDDGLSLHMYATDRWRIVDLEHAVQPHVPDLIAPAAEDAWSYVQLRGTVIDTSPTRITILHDTTEITVSIRPLVRYRAERLQKGDEIEVAGILDTRKDTLVILPRLIEEIRLIQSAPPKAALGTSHAGLPPWMPLGVAGASVAATQGVRRYLQYRKEQILRLKAQTVSTQLSSSRS